MLLAGATQDISFFCEVNARDFSHELDEGRSPGTVSARERSNLQIERRTVLKHNRGLLLLEEDTMQFTHSKAISVLAAMVDSIQPEMQPKWGGL